MAARAAGGAGAAAALPAWLGARRHAPRRLAPPRAAHGAIADAGGGLPRGGAASDHHPGPIRLRAYFLSLSTMLSQQLQVKRRILMVDLRNHGRSEHASTMSYEEMAADVVALLGELGISRAAVIGHSMGGKTAAVLALNHPEIVQSLGILDIAPVAYTTADKSWKEVEMVVRTCSELPLASLSDRRHASRLLEGSIPNPVMRQFVLTNLQQLSAGGAWSWKINVQAIAASLSEIEAFPYTGESGLQYQGQAFFIGGRDSTFIKTSHLPSIAAFFPQYTIAKIKNAGHWIHTEQPGHTLDLVSRFLDESAHL
eukprot:CAMPEP_0179886370 /NCGR_PEP_ID=MMETSP0982-20121206/30807_1 /TAXON_ID=483367 /ORGANISM="non described non described, Strain CCMP 2436" /LENGTH=311 /DNA_ID=CAMNT_0021782071 /DNA_START=95 /DNA_END=1031 /DNA_ORIENTATION=+